MIGIKQSFPWDIDELQTPKTDHKYKIKYNPTWKPIKYPKIFVDKAAELSKEIPSPDKYGTLSP